MPAPLIGAALQIGGKLIDALFPDPVKRAEAQAMLLTLENQGKLAEINAAMNVIVAEAQSDSWITRSWRPIIMLMFGLGS